MSLVTYATIVSHLMTAQPAGDDAAPGSVTAESAAEEAAKAPEEAKEEPGPVWTGTVGIGLVSLTGNSRSIAANGAGAMERKSESWIFGLKAAGAYGRTKAPDSSEWATNALNAGAQVRAAYRFTPRYSGYLLVGADMDRLNSIEARPYGEAGVGILWIDEMEGDVSKLKLNTDIAFRYGKEFRYQFYPVEWERRDLIIAAPRLGVGFRYALNKDVIFTEDAEALANVYGDARLLINSTTKIAARVVAPLSISAALLVKNDSAPAAGKVPTDTSLVFGVEGGF